jgi:ubiquinone/menaquinone biosynthesis C-methylase UbiE
MFQRVQAGLGPKDLEFCVINADNLAFAAGSIDRIVASCLIMHLHDPFAALQEWQRVCHPEGVIDFLVPCDPGLNLRIFRRLVSEKTAKRFEVSANEHRLINALDHVSSFSRILTLARASLYPERKLLVDYYPIRFCKSWNINAFAIFSIEPIEKK